MILNILYGLIFIAGGVALIQYRKLVKGWTGNMYWAESYLGNGGTYLVLIALGMGLIFYGVRYPFTH